MTKASSPTVHSKIIEEAIRTVGSVEKVAALYTPPISKQAISKWLKRGYVPPARVRVLSKATGIPRAALNPNFAE